MSGGHFNGLRLPSQFLSYSAETPRRKRAGGPSKEFVGSGRNSPDAPPPSVILVGPSISGPCIDQRQAFRRDSAGWAMPRFLGPAGSFAHQRKSRPENGSAASATALGLAGRWPRSRTPRLSRSPSTTDFLCAPCDLGGRARPSCFEVVFRRNSLGSAHPPHSSVPWPALDRISGGQSPGWLRCHCSDLHRGSRRRAHVLLGLEPAFQGRQVRPGCSPRDHRR